MPIPELLPLDLMVLLYYSNLLVDEDEEDVKESREALFQMNMLTVEPNGTHRLTERGEAHLVSVFNLKLPRARVVWEGGTSNEC